ncbi:unnamed protein product [Thelazia callipaeda]|uniref:AAA domain-containing protein n=1 Tax=Thelazia callipaeda TaxID=103827 RepID=A0A0N5D4K1_THECL|nr:unnamed protein product [Thelazia callipaeda]
MVANKSSLVFRSDSRLLPRIQKIHQANELYDAEDIARQLRQIYPEYSRRKYRDFIKSVEVGLEKLTEIDVEGSVESIVDLTNDADGTCNVVRKRKMTLKKSRKSSPSSRSFYNTTIDVESSVSDVTFTDIGGCEQQQLQICHFVVHLLHPEVHSLLGVSRPTGFLLCGPPGCGKTLLAQAVSGEFNLPLLKMEVTKLVSGVSGETEQKIRLLFDKAVEVAPCILLLDGIDAIAAKRENAQREMERRIVSQLVACLDDLSSPKKKTDVKIDTTNTEISVDKSFEEKLVLVIGTTDRVETIDPALRRAGRFDKEISVGIPDKRARLRILEIVCRGLRLDEHVSLEHLSRLTPGYVGADLKALAIEAAKYAVDRIFETAIMRKYAANKIQQTEIELQKVLMWIKSPQRIDDSILQNVHITMKDFNEALTKMQPSAKREGFATVPDVTWNDIGALENVHEELNWSILIPIREPELFDKFGIESRPQGILLCGPPGCGKTLIAKAVANESGMNFISVKGPELLSMYVGESEREVRTVFQRARDSSPCVIFFDEIDALCPKRVGNESNGSSRLVNQLLTEMDGMSSRKEVFLIGATNRPDIVDAAILRPGRLDKILFVDFPNVDEKEDILRKITRNGTRPRLSSNFSYHDIAADPALQWFTGADMAALVREAGIVAMKESISGNINQLCLVTMEHFRDAIRRINPSVPAKDRNVYQRMKEMYRKFSST